MEYSEKKTPLQICAKELVRHGFEVIITPTVREAAVQLREEIRKYAPQSISYGDSMTLHATGILKELKNNREITFYDGFDPALTPEERIEERRKGLLADLFITGINAISSKGTLHWLDMIGNRIAPIAFGPRKILLVAGKNKLVPTPQEAETRIREIAAPLNAARHPDFDTPCIKTGQCFDCYSSRRICNAHLVLERCFPKNRITVILIQEDAGL